MNFFKKNFSGQYGCCYIADIDCLCIQQYTSHTWTQGWVLGGFVPPRKLLKLLVPPKWQVLYGPPRYPPIGPPQKNFQTPYVCRGGPPQVILLGTHVWYTYIVGLVLFLIISFYDVFCFFVQNLYSIHQCVF